MKENLKVDNVEQSYDEMLYESYPYVNTSPDKLATLAALFGVEAKDPRSAKVLELGCAAGGNIIPHAVNNPKGQYVGVDISNNQVTEGNEHIKKLGLTNIELKHMSIGDIDEKMGKFDYIICHGVFSWVGQDIQEKIFEIANKNLTKNGIVYISYNTLPGWNMVRTVRDMMLYHSKSFSNIKDKVAQARALLGFIKDSLEGQDTAYAKMLSQEADLLSKQADCYIAHEHLENDNEQFYFSDFIIRAANHGMQYLSDVAISSMYLGNMKPEVVEKLKNLNNIIQTEQYMDFINNRRFRSTLLCHQDVKINRALNSSIIRKFAMCVDFTPEQKIDPKNIDKKQEVKFLIRNNPESNIVSRSPYLTAVFYILSENKGFFLSFDSLVAQANKLFKEDRTKEIEQEFENIALNLVIKGIMDINLSETTKDKLNLNKPKVSRLVQYQLQNSNRHWVTSSYHVPVQINVFDKVALSYMDGSKDMDQITDLLLKDVQDGKFNVNRDNQKIEDTKELKKELKNILDQSMPKYISNGIFC